MENRIEHILSLQSQIMVLQSRVVYRQTRILSGNYKNRKVTCAGIQLTEEELLKDEFDCMERHIQTMQKLSDNICILSNGGELKDLED